jgi:hypothetical protein
LLSEQLRPFPFIVPVYVGTIKTVPVFALRRLLIHKRSARNPPVHRGPLTPEQIGRWAERHFQRTGSWPKYDTGLIAEDPDETWGAADRALRKGERDLPGGSSLAKFLKTHQASGVGSIPVSSR